MISISQGYGHLIFPTPIETFAKTGEIMSKAYIYKCIGMTLLRTAIAFGISFFSALLLGFIAGTFAKFRTFMRPLIILIKAAPTAAFVFLFLVLSGTKYASIYIVIMLAFPTSCGINTTIKRIVFLCVAESSCGKRLLKG